MERRISDIDACSFDADCLSVDSDHCDEHGHKQADKYRTNVTCSKYIYAGIFLTAALFAATTYFFTSNAENTQFRSDFESFAREMAEIAEARAHNLFGQLDSLAIATAAAARENTAQQFPNVTIPHLDLRSQRISEMTRADMIMFVPFVESGDTLGFEAFVRDSPERLTQDYEYRGWDKSKIGPMPRNIREYPLPEGYEETRRGFVDSGFMEEVLAQEGFTVEGFSAPVSQFGPRPINASLAMVDLFTHPIFKKELIASLEYDVPVISEIEDLSFLLEHIVAPKEITTMGHSRLRSFTLDPVKRDFFQDSETIGLMVGVVQWETFFADVLPPSASGMVVTVVSDCGSVFTYAIRGGDGDDWTALGDHHDSEYDDMVQQFKFFWKDHPKGVSRHCHFDLHIYPSDEFVDKYISKQPLVYSGIVLAVFFCAAVAFYVYNTYIQQDKQQVVDRFVRAETVVKSLFPGHVGDQLMQEADATEKDIEKTNHSFSDMANDRLDGFVEEDEEKNKDTTTKSKPIADMYRSTTVMFADIVGFTKWASRRQPTEVFQLLETLYGSFDEAAKTYKIFKVETIGDCYVAVSGLPQRRRDHHIKMSLFAQECLSKMKTVCHDLAGELGSDTMELALRVGLHSGPVTAGVLRGERARFQLFGDTVNTASRMESTSKKNLIQVSQETAKLLTRSKKGHWLKEREDVVKAKGKGELQTYWLKADPESDTASEFDKSEGVSTTDFHGSRRNVMNALKDSSSSFHSSARNFLNEVGSLHDSSSDQGAKRNQLNDLHEASSVQDSSSEHDNEDLHEAGSDESKLDEIALRYNARVRKTAKKLYAV